mmetsp:Transcript_41419/g.81165  ORF Transcript_41419/g.81165 Transcript_41419/m.81165 type:complete len:173 (+) Transcript_41419:124-642(+)|eukprot:CAMPEP_0194304086 /NCGR_PEP_ID=MMETSP0171-20130528/1889_1 /TAXON_ID=218684 /ORGANISM="Corethron pennatum, Strain L29A3" /LENGTH=172 /DNA_ID=CAMNT_0039055229 /DNA_START=84 /DNA_END=602 /DNA_ORIENTATION=+
MTPGRSLSFLLLLSYSIDAANAFGTTGRSTRDSVPRFGVESVSRRGGPPAYAAPGGAGEGGGFAYSDLTAARKRQKVSAKEKDGGDMVTVMLQAMEKRLGGEALSGPEVAVTCMALDFVVEELYRIASGRGSSEVITGSIFPEYEDQPEEEGVSNRDGGIVEVNSKKLKPSW